MIKPTLISQIYFWNKILHVSDSSSVHHQEFFAVHTAIVYVKYVCKFTIISWRLLLRVINFSDKSWEKMKIYISCSLIFFFFKSCRVWGPVEKYGTARRATHHNIIGRMRFECCITKAINTHSENVVLLSFARQQWLRERT